MMDKLPQATLQDLQHRLLDWFAIHQRPLPWRKTYDPYHVWVAEIMGQQTQMDRVVTYFTRWIEQFPSIAAVASAPEQALLKAWEGLGYYSRVRNLQRAAKLLRDRANHGVPAIPVEYQQLLGLPGIGPYTAAAIASIAFNQPVSLLDANVERLFARLDDIDRPLKQTAVQKRLRHTADILLDRDNPRCFNQALMELGALVCTPKKPACDRCPVQLHCRAYRADTVEFRPVPKKQQKRIDITMACGIIFQDNRYFIQQRLPDDIWGGLWEFPGGRLEEGESPEQAAFREIEEETGWRLDKSTLLATVVHQYTRYRVTLHGFLCPLHRPAPPPRLTAASQYAWVPLADLAEYPYPAGHRQLLAVLRDLFPETEKK